MTGEGKGGKNLFAEIIMIKYICIIVLQMILIVWPGMGRSASIAWLLKLAFGAAVLAHARKTMLHSTGRFL